MPSFFHCDVSSDTFQDCVGAKKDGMTIEQLCSESKVTTAPGCTTVKFPDDTTMTRCY